VQHTGIVQGLHATGFTGRAAQQKVAVTGHPINRHALADGVYAVQAIALESRLRVAQDIVANPDLEQVTQNEQSICLQV